MRIWCKRSTLLFHDKGSGSIPLIRSMLFPLLPRKIHIYPTGDIAPHMIDGEADDCWCGAYEDGEEPLVVRHNFFMQYCNEFLIIEYHDQRNNPFNRINER